MIGIPGYQIVEVIHESVDVSIARGLREQDSLPVILKVLLREYPTPLELARYRHEFSLLRALQVPCVNEAYELVECGNTVAIAMEDCRGVPLNSVLAGQGGLSVADTLDVAIAIASGLADLHAANIIHKDINPANILLAHGKLDDIRIIDFGIAERGEAALTEVRADRLEGTLAYLSPEQTGRIASPLDRRTDLYAFGITLYEIASGQLPFREADDLAWVHAHLAKRAVLLPELDPAIPAPLGAIAAKLMAKSVDDRYQTAAGVLADLETCRQQWRASGAIAPFSLGRSDRPGQLVLPQQAFGRDRELAVLHSAFASAAKGRGTAVWIVGQAGIGKSTLVRSLLDNPKFDNPKFDNPKFDNPKFYNPKFDNPEDDAQ
ncbi:MAG: serine/threonine-protein kinase, partial [Cyanobacteria bacterium J06639_1]